MKKEVVAVFVLFVTCSLFVSVFAQESGNVSQGGDVTLWDFVQDKWDAGTDVAQDFSATVLKRFFGVETLEGSSRLFYESEYWRQEGFRNLLLGFFILLWAVIGYPLFVTREWNGNILPLYKYWGIFHHEGYVGGYFETLRQDFFVGGKWWLVLMPMWTSVFFGVPLINRVLQILTFEWSGLNLILRSLAVVVIWYFVIRFIRDHSAMTKRNKIYEEELEAVAGREAFKVSVKG